jgi:hypothetical protein
MFAVVTLLRPRRFVELGVHSGCSFFAANQVMNALDLTAEAIAVDTWQGDPQAGFYDNQVFADFSHVLQTRYPQRSYYIRATFNDAVHSFDDGSIDLLHIDGFHTYDAVKNDFETWLPKMSDRGVIMMHDITVYERDFGVWQLWSEITARYPTVSLQHCHGLGIVYVGAPESRLGECMRDLASDHDRYVLVNSLFRGIGDLSTDAAVSKDRAESATAELRKVEGELVAARSETAELRASTSWRLSAPIRMIGRIVRRR